MSKSRNSKSDFEILSKKLNYQKCQSLRDNKSDFEMWQQPYDVRARKLAVVDKERKSQTKGWCSLLQKISLGIDERASRLTSGDCGWQDHSICLFGAASPDQSALVVAHLLIAFFCPTFDSSKGRSTFAALRGAPQEPFWAEEFWLLGLIRGGGSCLDGDPLH